VVTDSTISRWIKIYSLGYTAIRERIIKRHGSSLIVGRMFKHFGLVYNFQYHKGKLAEFCKHKGLKTFVFGLSKGVEDKYFRNSNRCSEAREDASVNVKVFENTRLNKAIGDALKLVTNNKQRHSIVENFLLSCDRDTIATEVPVWYWEQKDWDSMYDMFTPELQGLKTKQNFSELMNYLETSKVVTARVDKVSLDQKKAYVYLTATTGLYESKIPALELQWINNAWKFNAFSNVFEMDLQELKKTSIDVKFISSSKSLLEESKMIISDFFNVDRLYRYEWSTSYCNDFRELNLRTDKIYTEAKDLNYSPEFEEMYSTLNWAIKPLKEATEYMDKKCGSHPGYAEDKVFIAERRIIELEGILNK